MSCSINEEITVTLSMQEVTEIAVACGEYQRLYAKTANKETLMSMKHLVDRLGVALYNSTKDHEQNNKI